MNKSIFTFFLLILINIVGLKALSQEGIRFRYGPSIPIFEFGDDDADEYSSGLAGVGLNMGISYLIPLNDNGFGLISSVDFLYNGIRQSLKRQTKDYYDGVYGEGYTIEFPVYFNIPVSFGINVAKEKDINIPYYINFSLAANLFNMTDQRISTQDEKLKYESDPAFSIGYKICVGLILSEKTTLEVTYLGLGTPEVDGVFDTLFWQAEESIEQVVKILTVTLSYRLKFKKKPTN